jgi:hypothetical protein
VTDFAPDPGGGFASDAHRRVMAHLPNPDDDPSRSRSLIADRINRDPHALAHFGHASQVVEVLDELEADGHAKELKAAGRTRRTGSTC